VVIKNDLDLRVWRLIGQHARRKPRRSSRFLNSVNFVLTRPVPTSRAANRFQRPVALLSALQPADHSIAVGVHLTGVLFDRCMPGFSSALSNTVFNGGFRYGPTTPAALGSELFVGASTSTAPFLQTDSFAAQNTPNRMNAGAELLRNGWPVPVGHGGRRRLLQQSQHPFAERRVIPDRLPERDWSPSPLRPHCAKRSRHFRDGGDGDPQFLYGNMLTQSSLARLRRDCGHLYLTRFGQ